MSWRSSFTLASGVLLMTNDPHRRGVHSQRVSAGSWLVLCTVVEHKAVWGQAAGRGAPARSGCLYEVFPCQCAAGLYVRW
eukprot:7144843-Prymnesium_polylepis.1